MDFGLYLGADYPVLELGGSETPTGPIGWPLWVGDLMAATQTFLRNGERFLVRSERAHLVSMHALRIGEHVLCLGKCTLGASGCAHIVAASSRQSFRQLRHLGWSTWYIALADAQFVLFVCSTRALSAW